MKYISLLIVLAFACLPHLVWSASGTAPSADSRPNILFILTDDQRHDMLGVVTESLVTPEMDRLATEGVRFAEAFANSSICAASRASMLTGLVERSHGFNFGTPPLRPRFVDTSYPVILRDSGYHTAYFGKLGVMTEKGAANQMFDHYEELFRRPYWKTLEDGTRRHLTDLIADRAISHLGTVAESGQPFCLTVAFNAPHAEDFDPLQYCWPPSADDLYTDIEVPLEPSMEPRFYENLPEYFRDGTYNRDRRQWRFNFEVKRQQMTIAYYRMVSGVDQAIGSIREALASLELDESTVVIFASDNGYFLGERGYAGKWLPHEPSIRIPLIVMDPRVAKGEGRVVADQMALNLDIPSTILDLAGARIPETYQGRSLLPFVESNSGPMQWRDHIFVEQLVDFQRIRRHEGVRTKRYKYARYFDAFPLIEELYDIEADPTESTNLINNPQYRDTINRLRELTEKDIAAFEAAARP